MNGSKAGKIELGLDVGAAVLFASAAAFAVTKAGMPLELTGAAVIVSFVGSFLGLRSVVAGESQYPLAEFALEAPAFKESDELLLTDADRLTENVADSRRDHELLLDDVLAELGSDSRVVRLFDASAMPTPGQLKSRIDEHLSRGSMPDASQALHDALADLRRSLR